MLNVTVTGDRQIVERLRSLPPSLQAILQAKTTRLALKLQAHVQLDKLSGQVLNIRSGALKASISNEVTTEASAVYGRVFSSGDVKYAAIHEFGGTIPAHDIVPNKAQALAFMAGGKQVFAKIVHMPAVNMPERSFLRSSLADMAAEISATLKAAVIKGTQDALKGAA